MLNLCRNAIEAMHAPDLSRRVLRIATSLAEPQTIDIEVRDTGTGIAKEVQTRIFDSFFSTKSDGIGMGLTICRSVAETHGGSVSSVSHADGGTSFHFCLPVS